MKDEKRKSQYKYELGREYAVPDKKAYQAIFRKYISTGEDGEENYVMIDMEREAQRAV